MYKLLVMKKEINIYLLRMHFPQTEYNEVCNLVKFSLGISIPLKFLLEQRNSPVAPNSTDT